MVGTLQPLDQMFSVVGEDGKPTDYFTRWAQQRQIDIGTAISLADLQAYLATISMLAGTGLTGGGTLAATRTFNIDTVAEAERIRDVIGVALVNGTGITITVDDALDTITIASTVTAYTDEMARIAISVTPTAIATTTYVLVLADAYEYIRLSSATGCAVTVPPNSSVAFRIGDTITFRSVSSAACSFVPGAGVTLNKAGGGTGTQSFAEIGATAQLKKVGTNEWDMIGGLT